MRITLVLAGSLLALSSAIAADTWRTPERFPPATGPSTVRLEAPRFGVAPPAGAPLPSLEVEVRDAAGKAVPGQAVGITAFGGKREKSLRVNGATDAGGKVALTGGTLQGVTSLFVHFAWDGDAKRIAVKLVPTRGGWSVSSAPYKRIADGANEGSCKNLFKLESTAEKTYRLSFRRPASLLECEEVVYGAQRKVRETAKVSAIGKRDVNVGDRNLFGKGNEEKMGLEASTAADKQYDRIDDPEIVSYVQHLMEKVVAASDQPQMPIHLRVVHTADINAFVTAGGHVYVFTGLIRAVQNESQLAGVLAHEASHAIARHVTEGATRGMVAQGAAALGSLGLGKVLGLEDDKQDLLSKGAQTTAGLVTLKYGRGAEAEADLLGTQYLWNAGWDPEGIARFFQLMEKKGGAQPPAWMSTHPTHEKRVQNGIQWARAFLPPKDRYLVDTDAFRAAQARVAKLAPPKARPAATQAKSMQQLLGETPTWKEVIGSATKEAPKEASKAPPKEATR